MKRILLSLGSAALAAALLCSCGPFQVAEKVVDRSDLEQIAEGLAMQAEDSANVSEAERAGLVRRTYTAELDVDTIRIDERYASIRIETGNVDRVQVSYMDFSGTQVYQFSESNYTLRITNDSNTSNVTYTTVITLPEKEYHEIEIEAGNSSVVMMDVAAESVWLHNSSNTTVLYSGLTSSRIKTRLINGSVDASDTTAYRLDVEIENGDVQMEHTQVDHYNCQVENGSIEGTLLGDAEEYNIRTSVDVGSNQLPSAARKRGNKDLQLHVGNGSINVQFAG